MFTYIVYHLHAYNCNCFKFFVLFLYIQLPYVFFLSSIIFPYWIFLDDFLNFQTSLWIKEYERWKYNSILYIAISPSISAPVRSNRRDRRKKRKKKKKKNIWNGADFPAVYSSVCTMHVEKPLITRPYLTRRNTVGGISVDVASRKRNVHPPAARFRPEENLFYSGTDFMRFDRQKMTVNRRGCELLDSPRD